MLQAGQSTRQFVETIAANMSDGLYRYEFSGIEIDNTVLPEDERKSAAFRISGN